MEKQERVAKLKKAITLFTIFKFVGLALLILGGVLFIKDMVNYVVALTDAMMSADDTAILNVFFTFILQGTGSMTILMLGLAALIVFGILGKKKKSAYSLLMVEIAQEATPAQ